MAEIDDKHDDRFVDDLLDSALARYAQAEPRPGLEGRLVARLRSEPEPRAFSWRWMPAAAAAVVVFAAFLYFAGSRESRTLEIVKQTKLTIAPAVTPPQVTLESLPTGNRPVVKQPSARVLASTPAPREQFPTPLALSEQEQLLVHFVKQTPPQELQALARQNRAEPIKVLRVDALEIPPVVIGESDSQ